MTKDQADAGVRRTTTGAGLIGSDVAAMPYGVLKRALTHPLTGAGLAQSVADWEATASVLAKAAKGGKQSW